MNDDLSRMSRAELASILDEAEEQISEIRADLERREQEEQHKAIDELELPVTRTAVDWSEVKAFFQQVLEELRGGSGPR